MTSTARLLILASVVAVSFACPRNEDPSQALTAEERIEALERAERVALFMGDLDQNGSVEIVLSPLAVSTPSASVAGAPRAKRSGALEELPELPSGNDVVLTRDAAGDLVFASSNEGFDFGRAERLGSFVPRLLGDAYATMIDALRSRGAAACSIVNTLVEAAGNGLRNTELSLIETIRFVRTGLFGQAAGDLGESVERYEACLRSEQTFQGCVYGDLAELFGRRDHCYRVSDDGSGSCEGPNVGSALCRHSDSSCCNSAFIFGRVFRSDVRNQAPLPLEPSFGPMLETSASMILGTPYQIDDIPAIELGMPEMAAVRCLLNQVPNLRNPITLTVDADARCATNSTDAGHILEGRVVQCIRENETGVYTTIEGTGENTRLSWLNERQGGQLFEQVRDHFRDQVQRSIAEMNRLGLTCDGDQVDGGTVTIDPDGGVAITPTNGATVLVGVAWGDPHLRTQDGTAYDFQKVGEFLLLDGADGAGVQVRLRPYGTSRVASVIVSLAAQVGSERVQVNARAGTARLLLNGVETEPVDLPGGGRLARDAITWPDGTRLALLNAGSYLSVYLYLPASRSFQGLLGDRNGAAHDDFRLRDGTVLPKPLDAAAWQAFAEDWRIAQSESLFEYADGESTATFTDLTFPNGPFTAASLSPTAYASARAICLAAGVTDPVVLDACILDVGISGDASFAEAARRTPAPRVGGQAAYDFAVAPESMTVDRVGVFSMSAASGNDGVFTATVQGPIVSILLHSVDANGNTARGQFWDTHAPNSIWYLGVEENGVMLNNADSSIPPLSEGVHRLKLYAQSSGYFYAGIAYRLTLTLPDGTTLKSPVLTY